MFHSHMFHGHTIHGHKGFTSKPDQFDAFSFLIEYTVPVENAASRLFSISNSQATHVLDHELVSNTMETQRRTQ
jgi:hypothetical protein